ncbi:hypothetical protein HPB48_008601 [Haemaphysalis longicornis]|uniref:Phorbol-ester/DAG-type domain-containing protein n=1 Tax=Haemaphysalis longicornis TaxID=44386 RepID=A0A9J6GSC4_HAELO|nr:hypothetical protein HPB48_008601 [Haemaphysalis longicornis]
MEKGQYTSFVRVTQEEYSFLSSLRVQFGDCGSYARRYGKCVRSAGGHMSFEVGIIRVPRSLILASEHITTIASLRATNQKLSRDLEDSQATHRETLQYVEQMESDMEGQKSFADTEMMKLNQTIAQQSKLINFLQAKVTEVEKKKKKLFWGHGGGKESCCGNPNSQVSSLESSLSKYQSKCRQLQDALDHSRAEAMRLRQQREWGQGAGRALALALVAQAAISGEGRHSMAHASETAAVPTSPKSRTLLTALTLSPSVSGAARTDAAKAKVSSHHEDGGGEGGDSHGTSVTDGPPPSLRMHHNIPHRFQVTLCMRPTKCAACLDAVHFGRYASRCQECGAVCHPKCSTSVPSTCGGARRVRAPVLQHGGHRVLLRHGAAAATAAVYTRPPRQVRAGLCARRSGGRQSWDKCFLVLCRGTLYLLDQALDPSGGPPSSDAEGEEGEERFAEQLEAVCRDRASLSPQDGEVLVSGAVSASELAGTAKSDLPYTFKLELKPRTTCWPPK